MTSGVKIKSEFLRRRWTMIVTIKMPTKMSSPESKIASEVVICSNGCDLNELASFVLMYNCSGVLSSRLTA